jgi:hypothetical protein
LGEAALARCPAPIEVEINRTVWMSANFQVPLHGRPPLFQESDCIQLENGDNLLTWTEIDDG